MGAGLRGPRATYEAARDKPAGFLRAFPVSQIDLGPRRPGYQTPVCGFLAGLSLDAAGSAHTPGRLSVAVRQDLAGQDRPDLGPSRLRASDGVRSVAVGRICRGGDPRHILGPRSAEPLEERGLPHRAGPGKRGVHCASGAGGHDRSSAGGTGSQRNAGPESDVPAGAACPPGVVHHRRGVVSLLRQYPVPRYLACGRPTAGSADVRVAHRVHGTDGSRRTQDGSGGESAFVSDRRVSRGVIVQPWPERARTGCLRRAGVRRLRDGLPVLHAIAPGLAGLRVRGQHVGDVAISVRGLCKMYKLYRGRPYRLLDFLGLRVGQAARYFEEFWALQDVTLDIARGSTVGVIGRNGAGKSTLLKLLSGVSAPTRGEVALHGRVSALLDLGTGFHPDLTGHENIFACGLYLGLDRAAMETLYDEIVAFAELGPFLHQPVRTYSVGMHMRLAFSVATSVPADIQVIDEVLGVGDAYFFGKCIQQFRRSQ